MDMFKCKMCGGTLEINRNETVAICEYCGSKQTLPRLDDERRANLYDRANHFRRNNEFDKAMGIYEQILNEDKTDAEAYWSIVLCRYGIEYVEDPSSHRRVPTVNRAQFTSIFDDENYTSALHYADAYQRRIYEEEAGAINEIQKGILEISQKEEPFDVFICYKESDHNGRRTPDSVLAQDLYYQLKQEGFRVFFSRITLEDKLGSAYEPYIFAALNSAKVMVVLGTKPEFFKAVWVRNEWSRYLSLIKQGQKKMLIPAYKDMDPYDLPEEFSHLQAQDMSKLGFMQDLIRGIKKITQKDTPKATVIKETVAARGATNIATLLKRVFMFLEDGDWDSANKYCEKVLDIDPENASAYLGKLMSELRVRKRDALKDCDKPFDVNNNYQKAVRFGDDALKAVLTGYIEHIKNRNENARLHGSYNRAKNAMSSATTEREYKEVAHLFEAISEYRDSVELARKCYENAEATRKDSILAEGKAKMDSGIVSDYRVAVQLFESISGWKDADKNAYACRTTIAKAEQTAKTKKRITIITFPIVCAVIAFFVVFIIPNSKYNDAVALIEVGQFDKAYTIFCELGNYKDSNEKANTIRLAETKKALQNIEVGDCFKFGSYEQTNNVFNSKADIEWLVLDIAGEKALVISKYALDCEQYNTSLTDVTWETCTLRKWLNNEFIDSAFSEDEKALILAATVSADKNPEYSTDPGKTTQDQVFLLSISEVNKYFNSDSARQCKPTNYAVAKGAYIDSGVGRWLLRTPGGAQEVVAYVGTYGDILELGVPVTTDECGVRPALWINLNT